MSNEYCDRSPCRLLQKFIEDVAIPAKPPATVQALIMPSERSREELKLTTFYYCPFCGTRLHGNEEVLKWMASRRSKS
jgi:hypothetical protein